MLTLISYDLETVSLLKVKAALEQLDMASTNTENKLKIKFFLKRSSFQIIAWVYILCCPVLYPQIIGEPKLPPDDKLKVSL